MKKHKKTEKRVADFLNDIGWMFDVNNLETKIVVKEGEEHQRAEVFYDMKYRRFDLTLYEGFFKESRDTQFEMLIHELCHVFTLPAKLHSNNLLDGHLVTKSEVAITCESTTSAISAIIAKLLKGQMQYARDARKKYMGEKC